MYIYHKSTTNQTPQPVSYS